MSSPREKNSHDSTEPALLSLPDSPARTITELPSTETVTTPPPTTSSEEGERQQVERDLSSSSSPTSSPSSNTSSSTATTTNGGGSGSNQPPSRRVKVYKLKDDAWVDLGTGTCRGVLNHSQTPPGDMEEQQTKVIDPEEEGAWIVVKREKPLTSKDKPEEQEEQEEEGEEEEEDKKNIILKTRVQPYPPGYSEDFDEEELLESEDGQTLDVGGYQRQQDTLIVWTERPDREGEEEMEMALSFATSTGCQEMWEFIKAARRFTAEQAMLLLSPSPTPSSLSSSPRSYPLHSNFNSTNFISNNSQLPCPSLSNIPQLESTIRAMSRTVVSRERCSLQIIKTGFIEKLIQIQQQAEDLHSLSDLHSLCRVMQTILLLNDNSIFELVLKDELILGVVGILEYDPDFPSMKASYKSHLSSPNYFISLVPIESKVLLNKIHQTHRLHYLKDVVLARILEDSTFSMLNSAIYFNEVEIVNEIVGGGNGNGNGKGGGEGVIEKVFEILNSSHSEELGKGKGKEKESSPQIGPELPSTSQDSVVLKKQQAIQFLTELTQMSKNLQLPLRTSMYRTLVEKGLLKALENALNFTTNNKESKDLLGLRSQVIQIWMTVVDLDAKDVRAYCLNQGKEKEQEQEQETNTTEEAEEQHDDQTMLGGLIETFKTEQDLGIKTHLAEALRVLLDAAGESGPLEAPPRLRAPEDPAAEQFLQYFYDKCILSLLEPLLSLPTTSTSTSTRSIDSPGPLEMSPSETSLLSHLCDLLCFFITHHSFRSKYLILSSPQLSKSISKILSPKPFKLTRHTHLRCSSLRFFKNCINKNDDFYNRFLIKHDLLKPVVETFLVEKEKDNLLGSACLEFFEYIRATNAKSLINHLMDRSGDSIRKLAKEKFSTFQGLISKWEINNEPLPPPTTTTSTNTTSGDDSITGGTSGAMSEAMSRQTSKPGWPSTGINSSISSSGGRMDVEEESYFNTDDDDDEDEEDKTLELTFTKGDKKEKEKESIITTSNHFGSSRRKREPTSNPNNNLSSNSGSVGSNESKRVKLDEEVDEEEEKKNGTSLPRSQTWPQGTTTGGGGLVDYMDEDEDDSTPAGGFIREKGKGEVDDEKTKPDEASSIPLPLPGALKRKQEEEEEEAGLGGLLRSKTAKKETSPSSSASSSKSKTSPSSTKPGGFKIAFGSSLSKSTSAPTKTTPTKKNEEEEEKEGEEEEKSKTKSGFGKFGSLGTTEPSSSATEKG